MAVVMTILVWPIVSFAADSNTVSSTVVTDKAPPTASAPSIVINNNDVCKSAASAAIQTQIFGFASGITVTDENCERLKIARSLYFMGMKVAAVSTLCQDARAFDAMLMAGTPCPYKGKIGTDALAAWKENPTDAPSGSKFIKKKVTEESMPETEDQETE
jgi:ribulose 1,5-bisphosphate synthetase/thiazole synthase